MAALSSDEKIEAVTSPLEPVNSYQVAEIKDVAIDTVNAQGEYTDGEYKRLLRRIDWFLLPLMWVVYGTQQADKTSVSIQATFGLTTDLRLHGQQFAWLSTIFYIFYLVCEAPGNYLMQRFNLGKALALAMFLWGIIVLCVAFSTDFTQIVVLRALQGAAECTISPSFLLITGSFYTTREIPFRSIIWGTANAGIAVITGFINYGIGSYAASHPGGLAPWKGISLFLGALTILLSIVSYFVLGTPREVRWLSLSEKRMAAARVVSNQTGSDRVERHIWKWEQVSATFKDPQTYFFFFVTLVNALPNGGTSSFGSLVYVSFGFDALETLLKGTIPQQLVSIVWFLIVGFATLKKPGLRFYFMMASVVPAFLGMLTLALLPKDGLLWVRWGMFLITVTGNLPGLLIWTMFPSNVAGRTKKAVTSAILFIAYCVGNAAGAQVFRSKDAPTYLPAILICGIMYGLEFVLFLIWMLYYVYQNKRRDRLVAEMGMSAGESAHQGRISAEEDMTDFENVHFRYSL